jgi:hypothetical protein
MATQSTDVNSLNSGIRFHQQGQFNKALAIFNSLLEQQPDNHKILHLYGQALLGRKSSDDINNAVTIIEKAISLNPEIATYHNDLGNAYWSKQNIHMAKKSFRHSIKIDEKLVPAHFNLGNCLWLQGDIPAALVQYERTIHLDSKWMRAHYMRANCKYALGDVCGSLDIYNQLLDHPRVAKDAHIGKASAQLKLGFWPMGWEQFDSRFLSKELSKYTALHDEEWNGGWEPDTRLLVFAEQGIGDFLMFARFLPGIRERVGKLILACDPSIHRLAANLPGIDVIIDKSDIKASHTLRYNKRFALMSITRILSTHISTIPYRSGYITRTNPGTSIKHSFDHSQLNIGIVWAGNPVQKDDMFRSIPIDYFIDLSNIDNVQFYSLQKEPNNADRIKLKQNNIVDLSSKIEDFRDTAELIHSLDLIISVDTAVSHLAGAMGKPVWTLLWSGCCWRYLTEDDECVWYKSMRLFRQEKFSEWGPVFDNVHSNLIQLINTRTYET